MLRFRLGSIPVEVHPSHLLVSALFAFSFRPGWAAWPLRGPEAGALVGFVLAWMVIVFVSVLVHELGHALASRAFGYRPSIALVWMGGHTQPNAPGPIPWHKDVALTLAGPLSGLALGLVCLAVHLRVRDGAPLADFLLRMGAAANFVWAILNLLPVPPLDGGRVVSALAVRLFGRRGFVAAQGVALAVSALAVVWGVRSGDMLLTLFFALFGLQAFTTLRAHLRGEAPDTAATHTGAPAAGTHPQGERLERAHAALRAGQLREAAQLAGEVLQAQPAAPLPLRSRAHHLLGWVALKEGRGRDALDCFAQVQGREVELHALAAAFSLVGDEPRALPLWELAWRQQSSPTLLHEYAGALLRAGRTGEALRLRGVDAAAAFQCATRVHFARGAYREAATLGEQGLVHAPHAGLAYDAACAYAQAGQVADALRLLERARELGFDDWEAARADTDLGPLHGQPQFERWTAADRNFDAS